MTRDPTPETLMSRRAALTKGLGAVGMTVMGGGLATSLTGCNFRPKAQAVPDLAKPAPALLSWPSLDKLAFGMVKGRLTPGLSLSVMHKGTLLYSKGFGIANYERPAAATPQTGFRIASISKQFTAAAILLLAEQGKLSLNDRLSRFLPDFPHSDTITLAQMLSHTAGLGDYINGQRSDILTEAQQHDYSSRDVLDIIRDSRPLYRFPPGTRWAYSNSGFTLASIVIERITGLDFATVCEEWLFKPAGMHSTQLDRSCATTIGSNGYRPNYRAPHGFDRVLPISPSFGSGAGGIRSTTDDLCRWHAALLDGRILKPQSLRAMLTPALLKGGTPAYERQGPDPMKYGLGMGLGTRGALRLMAHGGRVNGFTGHLRSFPEAQLTIAILYNSDGAGISNFSATQKALKQEASTLGLKHLGLAHGGGDDDGDVGGGENG